MLPEESVMAELDVVKQMAVLMKALDDEGKRRALWYLADLAGLSSRASQPQTPAQTPQMGAQAPQILAGGSSPRPRPPVSPPAS